VGVTSSRGSFALARAFQTPIVFEQALDRESTFVSRGSGYHLLLNGDDAAFSFSSTQATPARECNSGPGWTQSAAGLIAPVAPSGSKCKVQRDLVQVRLLGANPQVRPEGIRKLASYSNYLIGDDPRKWRTRVPQFAEVMYRNVYPGIDLDYRGDDRALEYDLTVAPHANAGEIAFVLEDNGKRLTTKITPDGDLIVGLASGELRLQEPHLYVGNGCVTDDQEPNYGDKPTCRRLAGGRFALDRRGETSAEVRFELPAYDHSQTLVIDPSVLFSTFLGGTIDDGATGIALDSSDNVYLVGQTTSPDFPTTPGGYQAQLNGNSDVFVTKMSNDGSHLIYSTYLGGSNAEYGYGIAVDSANNAYVTGETYSADFPLVNAFLSQNQSGTGFVSKLNTDGTALIYSTFLGGSLEGASNAIAVNGNGEAVVAGRTYSTDFPVVNAYQSTNSGNSDGFLTKLSADGKSAVFSTYFGGTSNDYVQAVALDPSGNIYLAGITGSTNFPTTAGSYQPQFISNPWGSSFVSEFNASGTKLVYSTFLVASQAFGITANSSGNAYVTGLAGETGFPVTSGAFQTVQGGGSSTDAFVTEFSAGGSSLVYSTYLGGNNEDTGASIALDASGNAYVTGETASVNFPLKNPVQAAGYAGVPDVFVSELNSAGSELIFSSYLGGGADGFGDQQGNAIAVSSSGDIYLAGSTSTPDFPLVNPFQQEFLGFQAAFVARLSTLPAPAILTSPTSLTLPSEVVGVPSPAQTITVTNNGSASLPFASISVISAGDFSETDNCATSIAPNQSCSIQVVFTPNLLGTRQGQISIASSATVKPVLVPVTGTGQDFLFEGTPGSQTIAAGLSTTYAVTLTPEIGFNQTVSLSCSGAPSNSTCNVSPASIILDGTDAVTATVTVITTGTSADLAPARGRGETGPPPSRMHKTLQLWSRAVLAVTAITLIGFGSRIRRLRLVISGLALTALMMSFAACGGGGSSSGGGGGGNGGGGGGGGGGTATPAGTYVLTFTASSVGGLKHALEANLTVN
jgi:hypothetical protein